MGEVVKICHLQSTGYALKHGALRLGFCVSP